MHYTLTNDDDADDDDDDDDENCSAKHMADCNIEWCKCLGHLCTGYGMINYFNRHHRLYLLNILLNQ